MQHRAIAGAKPYPGIRGIKQGLDLGPVEIVDQRLVSLLGRDRSDAERLVQAGRNAILYVPEEGPDGGEAAVNGLRKHGQFDILLYTTGPFLDPDSHLFGNYHSAIIPVVENEGSGSTAANYTKGDVDAWIDEAAGITDVDARRALYCQVAEQINKDLPRLFLYERLLLTAYRTNLQNFQVSPGPSDFTVDSQNWWLQP